MTPDRFKTLLAALSWSQRGLAERLGIPSHTSIRRWAAGLDPIPECVETWLERVAAPALREPVPPEWPQ